MYNVYNMYIIDYSYFVWKGIKTSYRPKNSTAPEPRPPVLKFLDPPLSMFNIICTVCCITMQTSPDREQKECSLIVLNSKLS